MGSNTLDDLVYLVRCAVDGDAPDRGRVADMDLEGVYRLARQHMLLAACGMALKSAGVAHAGFDEARGKAIRKVAAMDIEREELFSRLDAEGIWYAPLKGCVLQGLYPSYGMREMSDNDILFEASRTDEVRHVMESLGFSAVYFNRNSQDVYHKEPVCNFEMHRELFESAHGRRVYEYYRDVDRLLLWDGGGTMGRHLGDEDFYVYLVAHEHKHFAGSGTGLRSLLDTHVFLRERGDALDWAYVEAELWKLGLEEFELSNRKLATRLFDGGELDADDEGMLAYIAESGTYGTVEHGVQNGVREHGRAGYLLRRTFLPYRQMIPMFPVLRRAPVLLPACWVIRLGDALVSKRRVVLLQLKGALGAREGR